MKKLNEKVVAKKVTEEPKAEMEEAFALWKKSNKKYTGTDNEGNYLIAFTNGEKKNPNEPDIRVCESPKKDEVGDNIAALWAKLSKNDVLYYTGKTEDGQYLVGFINDKATSENMQPSIRVYFQQENESK